MLVLLGGSTRGFGTNIARERLENTSGKISKTKDGEKERQNWDTLVKSLYS